MAPTDENLKLVKQIVNLLVRNNCTVEEGIEILAFAAKAIQQSSKVQFIDDIF